MIVQTAMIICVGPSHRRALLGLAKRENCRSLAAAELSTPPPNAGGATSIALSLDDPSLSRGNAFSSVPGAVKQGGPSSRHRSTVGRVSREPAERLTIFRGSS
jgi:hypothetical protein